jgi:hypothetical protein
MDFSLVFEKTGDTIPVRTINREADALIEYYVDNINACDSNRFFVTGDFSIQLLENLKKIDMVLKEVNAWAGEITGTVFETCDSIVGYLDQDRLNRYHALWVESHSVDYDVRAKRDRYLSDLTEKVFHMFPDEIPVTKSSVVIDKLGYKRIYDQINVCVHLIENSFSDVMCEFNSWLEFKNPFPKSMITNDIANFKIAFNHLGRTLHDKYLNFDLDLKHDDENTFDQLLGYVMVDLSLPRQVPFGQDYIDWCHKHQKSASGRYLNIGNIPDLGKNLGDYRRILLTNGLKKNHFSIQLNKG